MRLTVTAEISNCRILWTNGEVFFVARGMKFWRIDPNGRQIGDKVVLGTFIERILSRFRLPRQLLRLGIHHLWPLPGGDFFVVVRKRAFRVDAGSSKSKPAFRFPRGNKPAHRGVCVAEDGTIFMGEYVMNLGRRHGINLYRSCDGGRSYETSYSFSPGEVRHVHFVQWDPYARCLWMGTGDYNPECRLYRSTDRGDNWEFIGGGTQFWRAVGVAFRPEALYWGTDAGSDAGDHRNYIMRLDRHTMSLDRVLEIQGPSYSIGTLSDGTIAVSTGVEGGANEKDNRAHVWISKDAHAWQELASFKKDILPFVLQFGVVRFPQGMDKCKDLVFTGMGLTGAGETGFFCRLT